MNKFFLIFVLLLPVSAFGHGYEYAAKIVGVYDGDTVTADIDLGFNTWRKGEKLRLARIDTPEVRGPEKVEGIKSREWLRARILGKTVTIRTRKDKKGKYGRYIVEIYLDGENINDALVREGRAIYKEYAKNAGKKPPGGVFAFPS